ncbi:TIGR02186 family protein [Sphingopyxis sp. XHP0097]|uniref:TIGR02186 family protein n=1 Tax=Sphingopyxis jiangsuensis TaxID=2871171 RepID=A0ABS7MFZ8_9SPHN|nr:MULTISPECIES: TIGR02186 family protein [Sphingopyxis]MBL0769007.1 TIGR02186 family protein [Sphingopyxis lutea]MBY4637888.1 TIGR02186 family protein [Sphingopyxis jiangsuensis]
MTVLRALIVGLALLLATGTSRAADPRLVPDVSSRAIDIQYSFTGEELLLFGAILYPGQRLPDDRADIVVVLKGPVRPIILREKRRVAGIWVNASSIRLRTTPGFYAIGSSRPIDKLVDERTAAIFELGLDNLSMSPTGFSEAQKLERFEAGLIDLYQRQGLFVQNPGAVEITEGVLYRARIPVPARVPVGTYRAETYLISRGRVLAVAARDVQIRKAGFERFVALAAEHHGFLYGLAAVTLSLLLGYVASAIFRRR